MIDATIVAQARATDMIIFLEKRHGFTFAHRGGVYRCRQHQSLAVKDDRLSWYWHSKGVGGHGAIDYLMKIEALPFRQAVETVAHVPAAAPISREQTQSKPLILPEKAGLLQARLLDYLCNRRGIGSGIVSAMLDEGRIYEDRRGNVVFIGFDEQGAARFASLRGTGGQQFRMDCAGSDKRYGFHMGAAPSERLYIFESPIDAMSHASLAAEWRRDNRLSLAGTSDTALPHYLNTHPHVREMVLCLDNDPAGREAAVAIARKYAGNGYRTRIELPQGKDYNADLLENIELRQRQKNTVKLHNEMSLCGYFHPIHQRKHRGFLDFVCAQ